MKKIEPTLGVSREGVVYYLYIFEIPLWRSITNQAWHLLVCRLLTRWYLFGGLRCYKMTWVDSTTKKERTDKEDLSIWADLHCPDNLHKHMKMIYRSEVTKEEYISLGGKIYGTSLEDQPVQP